MRNEIYTCPVSKEASGKYSFRAYALLALVFLLLLGCATPRNLARLPSHLPEIWSTPPSAKNLPATRGLLDLIDDPRLQKLVREALENNPDLQATARRLQASGFLLARTESRLWPSVSAGASKGRGNNGVNPVSGETETIDHHRLWAAVSWELDLWGKLADAHGAACLDHQALAKDYAKARDALAARVIQAWIRVVAAEKSIIIEEKRVRALAKIESGMLRRYREGLESFNALSAARTRSQVALADLSGRKDDHRRALRRLEILLGRYPQTRLITDVVLPKMAPPPVRIPALVLKNRPDVQALLNRVGAAELSASAARKALFPTIRLSSSAVREGTALAAPFNGSTLWNVLAALTQPIFEGGRLRNEAEAATLEAQAWAANLKAVVIRALKEAADTMDMEKDLESQESTLALASIEAAKSSRYFERRYRAGLDSIMSLLIAREQETDIQLRLLSVRAGRLANRVDMALALGIGIDEETAVSEKINHEEKKG